MSTPEQVVQRQLDAYNAKDLDGWLATYDAAAEQFLLHGDRLARGHGELRARMQVRFAEPDLYARLLTRITMGNVVVDHERITRNFPEGLGHVEMLCVYEVAGEVISKATFSLGTPTLEASTKSAA
jgi:hypothetical protein